MTRQEFIDQVNGFDDLRSFCYDYDCDVCEDIYDEDDKNTYLNEHLRDMAYDADSWQQLRDKLESMLDDDYYYYYLDEYGDFEGADDEFDDYKSRVVEWADDQGDVWDDADEEENEDDTEYYLPEEPAPSSDGDEEEEQVDQGASLFDLFAACASGIQVAATVNATTESEQPSLAKLFMQ